MTQHSIENIPDDYSEEGEVEEKFYGEVCDSINMQESAKACPVCGYPTLCFENKGMGMRFICSNNHLISINEAFLNN
jgi:hypothetical protein